MDPSRLGSRSLEDRVGFFLQQSSKRPPADLEGKVLGLLGKLSDASKTSFSHNEMARRYAIRPLA
jgi:hypothetical protein